MATVLRAFDYSFDGVTALKAKVGDDIDFGDMTPGLVAEGYVLEVDPPAADVASPEPEPAAPAQSPPETEAPAGEPVAAEPAVEPAAAVADAPATAPVVAEPEPAPARRNKRK